MNTLYMYIYIYLFLFLFARFQSRMTERSSHAKRIHEYMQHSSDPRSITKANVFCGSPRQNDIGTKQRSRELEMSMSPPKGMVGTIVAK